MDLEKSIIKNQDDEIIPDIDRTMDLTLLELVQLLNNIGGLDSITQFFTRHAYSINKHIPGVVGIKYIDGLNFIWQPKWSREARGRFYWIGLTKGTQVVELKSALQRGIEVLTKAHLDSGIDTTQDIQDPQSWDKLDLVQKNILKTFSGINPINSYLTAKVDGSLIIVNIYPLGSEQYPIIKDLVNESADSFTSKLVQNCILNNSPIITISTQGTLFIGNEMQDYFMTSIEQLIGESIESLADWDWVSVKFIKIVNDYYKLLDLDTKSMANLCFEAYCKKRTTITGKVHPELAIGYDHSGLNLLGMMYQSKYIPHFNMPKKIFSQPLFYPISNTSQVFDLMKQLDQVVLGEFSMIKFINNFNTDDLTSNAIHPEGFVLLTPLDSGTYDYAKIKTQLYYKCHKIKDKNINELMDLPEITHYYYPILSALHKFYDNMESNLKLVVEESKQILSLQISKESKLYQLQNPKGQLRWDQVIDTPNPDSKMLEVVYRMGLNTKDSTEEFARLLGPITLKIYQNDSDQMIMFVKSLLMKIQPWNLEWESRLSTLIETNDNILNELYNLIVVKC